MRSGASWYDKANALADAWRMSLALGNGIAPSRETVILALCVAEHETTCGDAWPGEHNWGACTKGALTAGQQAALRNASIRPVLSPASTRKTSEEQATAWLASTPESVPSDACIHVDSSPRAGPYFTLFGRFDTDTEGAAYFLHVLAEQRASCRYVLEHGAATASIAEELAADMYHSHYFTGFHDPQLQGGAQANIDDYARALSALLPTIAGALAAWTPGAVCENPTTDTSEPKAPPDLSTTLGVQRALNEIGQEVPLVEDGIAGPKTTAALLAFQASQGLPADGKICPATREALQAALDALSEG